MNKGVMYQVVEIEPSRAAGNVDEADQDRVDVKMLRENQRLLDGIYIKRKVLQL